MALLTGKSGSVEINSTIEAEGKIFGGCLSPFQAMIGTSYAPNLDDALLILEDINDHISRYDRMVGHMKQAGWLKNLSAIILGEFINTQDNEARPFGFNIEDTITNNAPGIPTINNAPFGHGDNLCTLPIGANAVLKNGKLSFKPLS